MRVRNIHSVSDDTPTLEKLRTRASRGQAKLTRATEALVENLTDQNAKLSRQNLVLSKLYRTAYRLLPDSLRVNVDKVRLELDSLEDIEVHPL